MYRQGRTSSHEQIFFLLLFPSSSCFFLTCAFQSTSNWINNFSGKGLSHIMLKSGSHTNHQQQILKKEKVKRSRYRPGVAQRVGRGIALLFHDRSTRRRWVVSSTPRPHFTPGKTRYPLYRRLGGPHGRSGGAENLVPTGIRSRTVQLVVSHYTFWAIRPTYKENESLNRNIRDGIKMIKQQEIMRDPTKLVSFRQVTPTITPTAPLLLPSDTCL